MSTASNFRIAHKPSVERWKALIYPGFEYYDVSDFGQIRNRKTNNILSPFRTNPDSPAVYVTLDPVKGLGQKRMTAAVSRVVWETWNNHLLPKGTHIKHINGEQADNRLVNLKVPDNVTRGTPPVVIELPTIRPDVTPVVAQLAPTTEDAAPALSSKEQEMLRRYEERQEHVRTLLACCNDWQTIEDVRRLGLMDSEWLWALEDAPELTKTLVLKLITLAQEK